MRRLVFTGVILALSLGPAVALAADDETMLTGAFNPAGILTGPRAEHAATLLPDGRVLVTGGAAFDTDGSLTTAEVWDPQAASFRPTEALTVGREGHTASLLPDGRVFIIGGTCCRRNATLTEMWDPATQSSAEAAPLVKGRIQGGHSATLLPDGRVLVIGGFDHRSRRLKLAEVWDPSTETFREAGRMSKVRAGHTATLLPDGRVLVIGGSHRNDNRKLAMVEAWDPATETFTQAGTLRIARGGHSTTVLPDGRALVVGGIDARNRILDSAEAWDPATETFSPAGTLQESRAGHTATLLPDGRVLVIAGSDGGLGLSVIRSAEVWDPATESFRPAGQLVVGRWSHTATLLPDGRVLVVGGNRDGEALDSAEVWDPTAEPPTPWPASKLPGARDIAAAHGRFVVVGTGGRRTPLAKAWVSIDGREWTRAPASPELKGAGMTHVVGTDDGFVALGTDKHQLIAAWHSLDGLTWDRVSIKRNGKRGLEAGIRSVVDGPGGLLALGVFVGQDYGGHRMWHSAGGEVWTPVRTPDVEFADVLVAIPGGYWLIGHDDFGGKNAFWRSSDGKRWERLEGAPWLRDAAVNDDGTVAAIGLADIWTSGDLEDWELVWPRPESSDEDAESDWIDRELYWIDWDGARFVTTGNVAYQYRECLDGVGLCPQEPWLVSEDGRAWVESSGPDGVPGPDRETYLLGTASLGDRTVALGHEPGGRTVAWLMEWAQ